MFNWLRNLFKSRVQRDRERGYYSALPPVSGTVEELNEAFVKKYAGRTAKVHETISYPTRLERLKVFYRDCGVPNPKELLMLMWPSQWLSEKLWPRWDPEDRNAAVAPKAGRYDANTGVTYCSDGRVVHKRLHVPGQWGQ